MQPNPPDSASAAASASAAPGGGAAGANARDEDENAHASLRATWATATPARAQVAEVVQELSTLALVGEGSVFERGAHVPATHMGFFKPPADAFLNQLRQKDRRSAKEWEYVNAAGIWAHMALIAVILAKAADGNTAELFYRLALAENAMRASRKMLAMRAQYFKDVTEHGVEMARQMSYLVEQSNDAVFSEAHRTARQALTGRIETEAAKVLAKARLEAVTKKKKKGGGRAADGDQSE